MHNESALSAAIGDADRRAQYDACVKRLLAQKVVLAYILQQAVPEFEGCPLEDIRDRYIEGVEISSRGLEPTEDNVPIGQPMDGSAVAGLNTESNLAGEGRVFYDIIFTVTAPRDGGTIRLIINVEAQKSDPSAYELQTRGIYYCARMLSAQKTVMFDHSDYQKLCKVYSIWVCTNPRAAHRNTITVFEMHERQVNGSVPYAPESYDKLAVILLNLGGMEENGSNPVLSFLEILLSHRLRPEEKKQALRESYGIPFNNDIEKEMSTMCNLSQGLVEQGFARGMAQGTAQGMQQGMTKGKQATMAVIHYLLSNHRYDDANRASVDYDYMLSVEAEMNARQS